MRKIAVRLEIIDVGCNLKQFDGLLDLTDPDLLYFTTDLRHCRYQHITTISNTSLSSQSLALVLTT